jgi:conjugal transfer pilus assembly protein TraF
MLRLLLLLFLVFLPVEAESAKSSEDKSSHDKSFYDDHARGWHWYERDVQSDDNAERTSGNSIILQQLSATAELKKYQEQLEEAKAAAVLHPTPKNVFNYQRMQYEMLQKSAKVAEGWMQIV